MAENDVCDRPLPDALSRRPRARRCAWLVAAIWMLSSVIRRLPGKGVTGRFPNPSMNSFFQKDNPTKNRTTPSFEGCRNRELRKSILSAKIEGF
jgi:hypothetical protein